MPSVLCSVRISIEFFTGYEYSFAIVVNAEVQSSVRKPTIDQEFEEYFSMLMM